MRIRFDENLEDMYEALVLVEISRDLPIGGQSRSAKAWVVCEVYRCAGMSCFRDSAMPTCKSPQHNTRSPPELLCSLPRTKTRDLPYPYSYCRMAYYMTFWYKNEPSALM